MKKFLDKIPVVLSSDISIFIFLFLFVYLFLIGVIGLFVPALAPSSNMQLVLGNYTNVTSALGAAISAGAATAAHTSVKRLHIKNDELQESMRNLHKKNDRLNDSINELQDKHDKVHESLENLHKKIDKISSNQKN
ncbi:hypothetical protein [Lactovum miscens]|uniref:Peptidoglycan hydrolase CwlO-like protein n=1 Tax=Lactovum miscens TaxID=190387 RepID=A0A841C4T4_9LACT|nr:hypothetical protein [Lactovum miscens]MBB5887823.1 peptidoglycan hydrolase CwlO-like protein [Lactovum miscens]